METESTRTHHVMTEEERGEVLGECADIASAMQSLEELCEMVSGHEERAMMVMPVIIEVARSTAERADVIRRLIAG